MPCTSECQFKHVKLQVTCLDDFTHSKISFIKPLHLAIYRAIIAVNCNVGCSISLIKWNRWTWPVYLTNLSYLILTIYFNIALVSSIYGYKESRKTSKVNKAFTSQVKTEVEYDNSESFTPDCDIDASDVKAEPVGKDSSNSTGCTTSRYYLSKIQLLFYVTTISLNFNVVLGFWILLGGYEFEIKDRFSLYLNLETHGFVLLYLTIEFILNRIQIRLLHAIYPMATGLAYSLCVIIVWACSGFTPYTVLNFSKSPLIAAATILGMTLVLTPTIHSLMFGCHLLLTKLTSWQGGRNDSNNSNNNTDHSNNFVA